MLHVLPKGLHEFTVPEEMNQSFCVLYTESKYVWIIEWGVQISQVPLPVNVWTISVAHYSLELVRLYIGYEAFF